MSAHNRTVTLALVFVGCLLILAATGGGIFLTFQAVQQDAREASAVTEGIQHPAPLVKSIYGTEGNLWLTMFREPFETVVFLFRDGSVVTFSTHDASTIDAPISMLVDYLKKSGRSLKDCLIVVHNHFTPAGFTMGDESSYAYLKFRGFRGVFGIYYTATGRFLGVSDR